ncbi:MAG: hypothetical protein Q8N88_07200 [Nanoarchaeota archaeon]|nr:hypothetical protein [Nanoarchaeota archaeon]
MRNEIDKISNRAVVDLIGDFNLTIKERDYLHSIGYQICQYSPWMASDVILKLILKDICQATSCYDDRKEALKLIDDALDEVRHRSGLSELLQAEKKIDGRKVIGGLKTRISEYLLRDVTTEHGVFATSDLRDPVCADIQYKGPALY